MQSKASITPVLSPSAQRKLVLTHLEELNTPRSLSIFMIMKYCETDDEILNLDLQPAWFNSPSSYLEFALPTALVKKWTGLRVSTDPEAVAKQKFLDAEAQCRRSNRRIRLEVPTGRTLLILDRARKILLDVLPTITPDLLNDLGSLGGWGTGVTSSCKGRWLHQYNKLGARPQATPAFLTVGAAFLKECPQLSRLHESVEPLGYNTVSFVPKTAKTHRAIAVEPSLNAFFQRAVGKVLQRPLRRIGINLSTQQKNRWFAERGARDGSFATIDLSSASDTISKAIVEYLFPREWVSLLGLLRSEHYRLDGVIHRYEKWSSMGNGYTFELESLLFGSIVKAIVGDHSKWCVYGDDIIVPVEHYDALAECLEWCGFSINHEKSFSTGPFRESCGEDFFLDRRVRPFYLKEWSEITPFIWANALRRMTEYREFQIKRTWLSLVKSTKDPVFGPALPHGLHLFEVNDWEYDPSFTRLVRRPYGPVSGVKVFGWSWQPHSLNRSKVDGEAAVAAHLRQLAVSGPIERFPLTVTAKDSGKWVRRSAIIPDEWPRLRKI